jgi:hypothetical protein
MGVLAATQGVAATSAGAAGIAATSASGAFAGLTTAITASQLAMAGLIGLAIGGAIAVWGIANRNQQRLADEAYVTKEEWGMAHDRALSAVEQWRMDSDLAMARGDYGDWIRNNPEVKYDAAMERELNAIRLAGKPTSIAAFKELEKGEGESELQKMLRENMEEMEALLGRIAGNTERRNISGLLNYAQMGQEDFFSIVRTGL